MKKIGIVKIVALSFAILIGINCETQASSGILQQGQERNLPAFNELNLAINAEVFLKQGPVQKVEIQASDRLLKLIETNVKGKSLTIEWSKMFVSNTEKIKIYITMVDVNGINISGSGDINAESSISTSKIDLAISGSGNINLHDLKAESISSSISGSADIILSGTNPANQMDASISGSGNIKAQDLPVKKVEVSISGSGNCWVNGLETIEANVAGSGDVYYKGNATIDGEVAGSGSIKHID